MRYAAKVKADPSKSLVADKKAENEARFPGAAADEADAPLTGRQKAALGLFFLAFLVMIFGVIPWEDLGIGVPTLWWWFPEMTASFLLFAILIGLVLAFLAFRFVAGAVKFVVILIILAAVAWFVLNGGAA